MTPSPFRRASHIELVAGQSDIGSFETEIESGKLGTTRGAHEVHPDTVDWFCRKLWLAVVGRAAKDATRTDVDDAKVEDDPQSDSPRLAIDADELVVKYEIDAKEWFRSGDFALVMDFVGLEAVAPQIAALAPAAIVANLAAFEKREEAARRGAGKCQR